MRLLASFLCLASTLTGCASNCTTGARQCSGSGKNQEVDVCNSGKYILYELCTGQSCISDESGVYCSGDAPDMSMPGDLASNDFAVGDLSAAADMSKQPQIDMRTVDLESNPDIAMPCNGQPACASGNFCYQGLSCQPCTFNNACGASCVDCGATLHCMPSGGGYACQ